MIVRVYGSKMLFFPAGHPHIGRNIGSGHNKSHGNPGKTGVYQYASAMGKKLIKRSQSCVESCTYPRHTAKRQVLASLSGNQEGKYSS